MNQERMYKVILSPHVSEKTTIVTEKLNVYVFEVAQDATKSEIKDAVEFLFNTKVKSVHTMNVKSKKRMFRNIEGRKKGWKKAYVSLLADQKLDIFDSGA